MAGAPQEQLRLLTGPWVTAWNAHDLDALETLVTEDVTWEDPAMRGHTVQGRAEFRAFAGTFFRAFPDVRVEGVGAPYLALDGSGIALRSRMSGTFTGELTLWQKGGDSEAAVIPPTGRRFDIRGVDLYEFREGLVSSWTIVYDLVDFSQQIGLLP
jgi:steroid delta-isomerase-like uncharacterized protein